MLKEKLNAFIGVIKKNAQPLVFSAISGWLLTASLFLIFFKARIYRGAHLRKQYTRNSLYIACYSHRRGILLP